MDSELINIINCILVIIASLINIWGSFRNVKIAKQLREEQEKLYKEQLKATKNNHYQNGWENYKKNMSSLKKAFERMGKQLNK